ncbi:necrosis inducing-like protein NPP1 type [Phytophthora cinnamomi]|uniref:necrosis inducing-like protein NPP1 type n=1 Tax=Phytophthora cinnamomi TaxID=4785 RepID=UPI003559E6DC|nr:necrosis inducing-like protein NPP1 type [Phytophthora cinnamomi]
MNLRPLLFSAVDVAAVFGSGKAIVIDHDKVQPFAQPDPVTLSEKAIMYAWHFPKEQGYYASQGSRHKWSAAVVWLDNPAFEKPKILAVSTIGVSGVYTITKNDQQRDPPFGDYINETSPMLAYLCGSTATRIGLAAARDQGEFQDLIMWDQLTQEARSGLSNADFAPPSSKKPSNQI